MSILKSCRYVFLLSISLCSMGAFTHSFFPSATIQRLGILGLNDDGDRGAFIYLHFGPSSQAPFAHLVVIDSSTNRPIMHDAGFFLSGGEAELSELARQLIDKNKQKMEQLGINLVSPVFEVANYIVETNSPEVIKGTVDIEEVGQRSFSLTALAPPDFCEQSGNTIEICLAENCSKIIPETASDCWGEAMQLKSIYRSKNSLWFFVYKKIEIFPGEEAYFLSAAGIKF